MPIGRASSYTYVCVHLNSVLEFNKSTLPPHFSQHKPSNTPSEDNIAFRLKGGFKCLTSNPGTISFEYKSVKDLTQLEFIIKSSKAGKEYNFGMFVRIYILLSLGF